MSGSDDKKTYTEAAKEFYNKQYENWVPWLEDKYLQLMGKDNKASYATKQELDKTKVTGIQQVDTLQDGVNNLVSGQVGKGGLAQPIGDLVSKEGINRVERGGKDEQGHTAPGPLGNVTDPIADNAKKGASGLTEGAKGAGGYLKGAGGYVGGLWGGKKEENKEEKK